MDRNRAVIGKLDRIGGQVQQDLPQPPRIAHQQLRGLGSDTAFEVQPLVRGALREFPQRVGHRMPQGEVDTLQVELACLDLGKVQNIVDESQ